MKLFIVSFFVSCFFFKFKVAKKKEISLNSRNKLEN